MHTRLVRIFYWLPELGIGIFLVTYALAASMYPGGTRWDEHRNGFSMLHNFWCDLLQKEAWCGRDNLGQPFALVGSVVLPLAVIPFWCAQAQYFSQRRLRWLVGCGGSLAMCAAALLPWVHDGALNVGSALLALPTLLVLARLWQMSDRKAMTLAMVASSLSTMNFAMWHFAFQQRWMPTVQALALTTSLLFILHAQRAARADHGELRSL